MKKSIAILSSLLLVFSLFSCSEPENYTVSFKGIEHESVVCLEGSSYKLPYVEGFHVGSVKAGGNSYNAGNEIVITGNTELVYSDLVPETELTIDENGVVSAFYKGSETVICIPRGVKEIRNTAFAGRKETTAVIVPDTVTVIGDGVLSRMRNLEKVVLPDTLVKIERNAFIGDVDLASISIPDSVVSIGHHAFSNTGLKTITIPSSVVEMEGEVFADCKALETIKVDKMRSECSSWGEDWHGASSIRTVTVTYKDGVVVYPESQ